MDTPNSLDDLVSLFSQSRPKDTAWAMPASVAMDRATALLLIARVASQNASVLCERGLPFAVTVSSEVRTTVTLGRAKVLFYANDKSPSQISVFRMDFPSVIVPPTEQLKFVEAPQSFAELTPWAEALVAREFAVFDRVR